MHLRLFVALGLLYALTGVTLHALYWRRIPWQIPFAFMSFGTGIFVAVNRWWLLADFPGGTVLSVAALLLLAGWITAVAAVFEYLSLQREMEALLGDGDSD